MSTVVESVDVSAPVRAVYNQCTQFEEFPRFMEGVREIRQTSDTMTHWVVEIGGQRRYSFYTSGQQTLFQRCYAERGFHDFAAGFAATLNAFVQCQSDRPYSFSGSGP